MWWQGAKCSHECKHGEMTQHQCKLVPVACGFDGCDSQPSKSRLANHRKQCEHRPQACPNKCGEQVSPAGLSAHRELCPQQEITCGFSGCGVRMFRAVQAEHDEQNMPKHLSGLQHQNATLLEGQAALEQRFAVKIDAMQQQFNTQLQQLAASINAQPAAATPPVAGVQQLVIPALAAGQTVRNVPLDYPTIQAAINAADVGDRVLVAAGVYNESLTIRQQVEVVGASRESTVVQTNGMNTKCCIIEDVSCMLANIQMKASGSNCFAVSVSGQAGDVTLVDCDVSAADGMAVYVGSICSLQNLVMRGCRVHHSNAGIWVSNATAVRLEGCTIEDNVNQGVVMTGGKSTLSGCTITRNKWGVMAINANTEVTILENNDLSGNRSHPICCGGGCQINRVGH